MRSITGWPVRIDVPRSPVQTPLEPVYILDINRLVQPQLRLELFDLLEVARIAQNRHRRIARQQVDQPEQDDADDQRERYHG